MTLSFQNDDELLEQFEHAWTQGTVPEISEFCDSEDDGNASGLLVNLIELDYEYRWKNSSDEAIPKLILADYVERFGQLERNEPGLERLLIHEHQIRKRWGDSVSVADLIEHNQRLLSENLQRNLKQQLGNTEDSGDISAAAMPNQIDEFRIVRKLAEGGMGAVYLAEQLEPVKRQVALKVIKQCEDMQQVVARFEAERQALALMDHPNIARIYDGGTTPGGTPYFVMELVDGVPLTQYCDTHKLSIRQRLELFVDVCQAVQHAHKKGIIHRDLKPSNVLVTTIDGRPVPKVIDFGLAKATEHTLQLTDKTMFTEFGQVIGTVKYMSPEQAEQSEDIDSQTDVYSLGVMLYELLTGSTPLTGKMLGRNLIRALERIQDSNIERPSRRLTTDRQTAITISQQRKIAPSRLRQILHGELDWIVMKSLERERQRRFETPDSFAADIRRFLNNEPVVARPPSRVYRLQKFVRKNLAAVLATLLTVVGLAAASVVSTLFYLDADEAREAAEFQSDRAEAEKATAIEATARAKKESRAHERVSDRLTEVMNSGDPLFGALLSRYGSIESPATVRDVVDRLSREELDGNSDLNDVPLVRAHHLDTLGDKQVAFGNIRTGRELYQRSSELYAAAKVTDSLDLAKNLMALGTCDYLFGDLKLAEERLLQSLQIRDAAWLIKPNGRTEIRDLAFTRFVLAGLYMDVERFADADRLLDLVIPMDPKAAPEMPLQIAMALLMGAANRAYENEVEDRSAWSSVDVVFNAGLGIVTAPANQRLSSPFFWAFWSSAAAEVIGTERLPAFERMHRSLIDATGEDHFLTSISRWGRAYSADLDGNYEKTCEYFESLIAFVDRTFGRKHPRFAMVLDRYADVLFDHWRRADMPDQADIEKAHSLASEAVQIRSISLGDHRQTGSSLITLGRIEQHLGEFDSGLEHLLRALEIRKKKYGLQHRRVLSGYQFIVDLLVAAKRYDEAEKYGRELLESAQKTRAAGQISEGALGSYTLVLARLLMFEKTNKARDEIVQLLIAAKSLLETDRPATSGLLGEVKARMQIMRDR